MIYGHAEQGGHLFGKVAPGTQIQLDGELIQSLPNGQFVIGFSRDSDLEHQLTFKNPDGSITNQEIKLKKRKYAVQHIRGVPPETVNPPESAMPRIRREAQQVRASRSGFSAHHEFMQPFVWPLFGGVTGVYGSARSYNGQEGRPHYGLDISGPKGRPVFAPAGGTIVLAEPDLYFSGGTIIVDHGMGLSSTLIHLSKVNVTEGQEVVQGQQLGLVGSTGRSTGPHLDWRMNWGKHRINPALFVPPQKDICDWNSKQGDKELVVLLHGLGRTKGSMNSMAEMFRSKGYQVCNQGYPSRDYPLEELATYVANVMAKAERRGVQKIHFVTHSMGGILLRYYLQYQQLPKGSRIVMLAPPNKGSEIIDQLGQWQWFSRLMGPAAMQLSTGTESMPNTVPGVEAEVGVIAGSKSSDPWFNWMFSENHDGKVSVTSAKLNNMTDFLIVPSGHTLIMQDALVQARTLEFIQTGQFESVP